MDSVIIVAGGSGKRMGSDIPKQFLPLAGKPVLMHTIEAFHRHDPTMQIIVVIPESQHATWLQLCKNHHFIVEHSVVYGGKERFHSVLNGLNAVAADAEVIAIHDGVRPLADSDMIERCITTARSEGNAIPTIAVVDSLRTVDRNGNNKAVNRNLFRAVQTPQCFRREIIVEAYNQGYNPLFTDDASVIEAHGHRINLIDGSPHNIKITTPIDLIVAAQYLINP